MEYLSRRKILTIWIAMYCIQQASSALSECGGTLRGRTGTFTSPNYPHAPKILPEAAAVGTSPLEEGDDQITCEWKVIVTQGFRIELNFGDFDMAAGQDECGKGELEIFSGIGESKQSLDIYCGSDELGVIMIESNSVTIVFRRPSDFSGKGFIASYFETRPGDKVENFISCNDQGTDLVGTGSYSVMCPGGCADISEMVIRGNSFYRDDSFLCKAAVHAGVITDALGGNVEVKKLPGQLFYWGTEANGVISEPGALSDMKFRFVRPDAGCNSQIHFNRDQLTASSYWTEDENDAKQTKWKPANAILEEQIDAWSPNDPTIEQWLQVDLKESKVITGIMTRGSSDTFYTTKHFRIAYSNHSTSQWKFYRVEGVNYDKVFRGNRNIFKNTSNNFIQPRIVARFLRVYPTSVNSESNRYSLQIALYGCSVKVTVADPIVIAINETSTPAEKKTTAPDAVILADLTDITTKHSEIGLPPKSQPSPPSDDEGIGENSIIIIAIVAALSVTSILLAALVLFLVKKRKKEPKDSPTSLYQLQSIPDNNNTGFQYKSKKSRKRSRQSTGEHFQNADYKDTLLPSQSTVIPVNQVHLLNGAAPPPFVNGVQTQKQSYQPTVDDSFSDDDDEDHEYQVIDDDQVAANIGRGSSKASTGSSLGNHSRKSDTMQRMWGVDGSQWQRHQPTSPHFQIPGHPVNGHPYMSSFSANQPPNGTFFPPKNPHLHRNHTFSHEARYSTGDSPSHPANLRRGNSQSPSRMQRHSSSSNNSSHSYPTNGFYQPQGDQGPYYSSVPSGDGNPVVLNHVMYGRESIPEQKEINTNRRAPSYKIPRSFGSELPALPDQTGVTGSDPSIGAFGRTGSQATSRSGYDRLYRNSSSGGADTMNSFSISDASHSQYDQLNLNGASK